MLSPSELRRLHDLLDADDKRELTPAEQVELARLKVCYLEADDASFRCRCYPYHT